MANAVELGQLNTNCFGYDQRIRALVALARALWLRGFSEQALRTAQQAIDEAERRDHPVSVCISLIYAAPVFLWRGDLERAADFIERLIAYAGRYSLAPYRAVGMALKGELAVTRDQAGSGLILLRNALETLHAERHNILATVFASALAEGLRKTGQFDEALVIINGAVAQAASCGATFDMAELLRINGQILAAMPQPDRTLAANCLMQSLAVAREQSALAWELRSATALARLLSENGQRDQARDTLAPVYDRFTEGFETADLRVARLLIHDLA
jgi:predicted ATPase